MAADNYADLARHFGHEIVCVQYGDGQNFAVECEECGEVLLDFDLPDPRYTVELAAEGFQILDAWTDMWRADVWSSREQSQDACDELNDSASAASAS